MLVNNRLTQSFAPLAQKKSCANLHIATIGSTNRIHIGALDSPTDGYWSGKIYDVILFRRVLLPNERAYLQLFLEKYHKFSS